MFFFLAYFTLYNWLKKKFMGRINRFKIQCIFLSQEVSDQAQMLFYCLSEKEFFSKHYPKNIDVI